MSRQWVYSLVKRHKKEGIGAYKAKKAGRPRQQISSRFVQKTIELRKETDYGSEKLHFVFKRMGFGVSQYMLQRILDENRLTEPCENRRGQRKYVRYCWPISNYMWHVDWSQDGDKWYCAFIDDCSRKIISAGEFTHATEDNTIFLLYQAILSNEVCPNIILSDKGSQFYANKYKNSGEKGVSRFEEDLVELGIEFWTSRRNHPQTNGKMEKWFHTLKSRMKKHPNEKLQDFVKWYNEKRIHHALEYKTPEEVYQEKL